MADVKSSEGGGPRYRPYVPPGTTMTEFSALALLYGLVMSVILGAANAYLGLKAGMTIAATYPAAVISMALLRITKGSILEENISRTIGSIGESVAAGAIFTIPAFIISGVWSNLEEHYWEATAIMMVGGIMGVLFVTMLRRVMVEDVDLPYPESVAAGEIHKAGRAGGTGALYLVVAGVIGAAIQSLKQMNLFASSWEKFVAFKRGGVVLGRGGANLAGQRRHRAVEPGGEPGVHRGRLHHRAPTRLAELRGRPAGVGAVRAAAPVSLRPDPGPVRDGRRYRGVLARPGDDAVALHRAADRDRGHADERRLHPVAHEEKSHRRHEALDLRRAQGGRGRGTGRPHRAGPELSSVLIGIGVAAVCTFFLYNHFSRNVGAALTATVVMIVAGFFFAAVSAYLVGMIGSSNNPISGLTLSTVIIAALLMVALGQTGTAGIAAVLGVAGVICVSAAVAGEMLQDLKVGHILGGTPWKMQVGDLIGTVVAFAAMFYPILVLHQGDIKANGTGLGGANLPAPQASLMALVSQGIVGGDMAWPLMGSESSWPSGSSSFRCVAPCSCASGCICRSRPRSPSSSVA